MNYVSNIFIDGRKIFKALLTHMKIRRKTLFGVRVGIIAAMCVVSFDTSAQQKNSIQHSTYVAGNQAPKYPKESLENNEEGTVILAVFITSNGRTENIEVRKSSGYQRLDEAAVEAVKNWRFNPAKENGVPIDRTYEIPITFKKPNEKEKQEARKIAKAERESQEVKRRQWQESPEIEKFQADEALKAKKAKEEKTRIEERERKQITKEFPFFAVVTCGLDGRHLSTIHCFDEYGSIEIRNGEEYGLYKGHQVYNARIPNASESQNGLEINLRREFEITAQNGDDLILGIKIYDSVSKKILFQKQVDKFGVIKVRN